MKQIVGAEFAIAQDVTRKVVNVVITKVDVLMIKKTLKKRLHNKENKVILCAGIAPMATYEADCWSGVCYSSSCYSMGC